MEITPIEKEVRLTLQEVAKLLGVGIQAVYKAIWSKSLKAKKNYSKTRWLIKISDVEKYRENRWAVEKKRIKGRPLFNIHRGEYSVKKAADILNMKKHQLLYLARINKIKTRKKGRYLVVNIRDMKKYKNELLKKNE